MPNTIHKLSENVEWLIDEGFRKISIGWDFFSDWSNILQENENQLIKLKEIYIKNHPKVTINLFEGSLYYYVLKKSHGFCQGGYSKFIISTDGKRYPCSYVVDHPEFCYGELGEDVDREFRKTSIQSNIKLKHNRCANCKIDFFCIGRRCGFLNYKATGYLNMSNESLCIHQKFLYTQMKDIVKVLINKKDNLLKRIIKYAIENECINDEVLEIYNSIY